MTQEEKIYVAKLIRKETGCGIMEASTNFDKLLIALKNHPLTVMDNQPYELKISWTDKQQELSLEEFIEKMDDWKARFSRPDDIPVKATMAFTARMFFMYPNVARQWYESLPKATQD